MVDFLVKLDGIDRDGPCFLIKAGDETDMHDDNLRFELSCYHLGGDIIIFYSKVILFYIVWG